MPSYFIRCTPEAGLPRLVLIERPNRKYGGPYSEVYQSRAIFLTRRRAELKAAEVLRDPPNPVHGRLACEVVEEPDASTCRNCGRTVVHRLVGRSRRLAWVADDGSVHCDAFPVREHHQPPWAYPTPLDGS